MRPPDESGPEAPRGRERHLGDDPVPFTPFPVAYGQPLSAAERLSAWTQRRRISISAVLGSLILAASFLAFVVGNHDPDRAAPPATRNEAAAPNADDDDRASSDDLRTEADDEVETGTGTGANADADADDGATDDDAADDASTTTTSQPLGPSSTGTADAEVEASTTAPPPPGPSSTSTPSSEATTTTADAPTSTTNGSTTTNTTTTTTTPPPQPAPVWVAYLTNPGTGSTTSSRTLALSAGGVDGGGALPNYDTDRDDVSGLSIAKDGSGLGGSDPTKYQDWTWTFDQPTTLSGSVTAQVWVAAKDFADNRDAGIRVGLYLCDPGCVLLDTADWTAADRGGFQRANLDLGTLDRTVPAGTVLRLRVVAVDGVADADIRLAYDTASYPSSIRIG